MAITALLILAGCDERVVYSADVSMPGEVWDRSSKPQFSFDIADTVSHHDLYIDVRHTGDYAFSSLYVFLDLLGPDERRLRDTVECILADPTGRWYGKGTGFIFAHREYDTHVLYKLHNRFPAIGRYTITLEQAMRTEQVHGVVDIGISVERSK